MGNTIASQCTGKMLIYLVCCLGLFCFIANGSINNHDEPVHLTLNSSTYPKLRVKIASKNGKTVVFKTPSWQAADHPILQIPDKTQRIPLLVLHHNAELTSEQQRTVMIRIDGISIPPGGVSVILALRTQHPDPERIGESSEILVFQEVRPILNLSDQTLKNQEIVFTVEFQETIKDRTGLIPTPTDYYQLELSTLPGVFNSIAQVELPNVPVIQYFQKDYAFLLEDQWSMILPQVDPEDPGAGLERLVLHTCDMFMPKKTLNDGGALLSRDNFTAVVQTDILPRMLTSYVEETIFWDFSWYPEWKSLRPEDGEKNLSVVFSDGKTWYHGEPVPFGNASITLTLNPWIPARYDTIPDALINIFYHELFHNLQRSMLLHYQGTDKIAGKNMEWDIFSEGTAVLASTVGMPEVEYRESQIDAAYFNYANEYLSNIDRNPGLLSLKSYQAAPYWRFLFEQCGGNASDKDNLIQGMAVIRRALENLYKADLVDFLHSKDSILELPRIMDPSLAGSGCPFDNFKDSLNAYAIAINSLSWPDGRILTDPNGLYLPPPKIRVTIKNKPVRIDEETYPGKAGIAFDFGFDLIEIEFDREIDNLAIDFSADDASEVLFDIVISGYRIIQGGEPEWETLFVVSSESTKSVRVGISSSDLRSHDRLSMIIIRQDSFRKELPGHYRILIEGE